MQHSDGTGREVGRPLWPPEYMVFPYVGYTDRVFGETYRSGALIAEAKAMVAVAASGVIPTTIWSRWGFRGSPYACVSVLAQGLSEPGDFRNCR